MGTIPPKLLKSNVDIFCFLLTEFFNKQVEQGIFPNKLKLADISSIFKKDENICKKIIGQ